MSARAPTVTPRTKLGTLLALPLTLALGAGVAFAQSPGTEVDRPSGTPDASFSVTATPDAVLPEDGERGNPDASGQYDLELFTDDEIVCFDISVSGVSGDWESPAPTANHIHRGAAGLVGLVGPAMVIFPDAEMGSGGDFVTTGCLQDAFNADEDISLSDIASAPAGFYVDIHTSEFPRGDVRGNLQGTGGAVGGGDIASDPMPAEGTPGPEAGFGGALVGETDRTLALTSAVLLLALAGAATASQLAGRRSIAGRDDA